MMNKVTAWKIAFILTAIGYLLIIGMLANRANEIVDKNAALQQQVKDLTDTHKSDVSKNESLTKQIDNLQEELRDKEKADRGGERETVLTFLGTYTLTAFCGCELCCGEYARNRPGGIVKGAAGIELKEGISVAAPLPIGTKLLINGHRYIVQDRTASWIADKYDGRIVDIYFSDHEAARNFGKQQTEVFAVK
jgi:3D (Asp-Asp-Asp) domain-containing protein/FtsZ-binding cell division protein ZapB